MNGRLLNAWKLLAVQQISYRYFSSIPENKVQKLVDGILARNRARLAEAITLIESSLPSNKKLTQQLLTEVMKVTRQHLFQPHSFRVGISGAPGVGKSTFIESVGTMLTSKKHRVAVLAVDPSSVATGGSLMGDKTRMPELTRDPNAYIRPSPSRGALVDKAFVDEVTTCCQHGIMEVQKQGNPNCELISRRSLNVLKISGLICRTSMKVCCMKQIQQRMCDAGMEASRKGETCRMQSQLGNEDHHECCNCCYLGIEAKRRGMSCQKALLGYPCQRAFFKCCLSNVAGGVPSALSTVQPTTPRQTCVNLRCAQSCTIFNGKPTCVCRQGFYLGDDKRSCFDVNECNDQDTCKAPTKCVNSIGSYRCIATVNCPQGFVTDQTGRQCQDINECLVQGACKDGQICENRKGTYRCKNRCPTRYVFKNDRCELPCPRGHQWSGYRCEDIDECLQNPCKANEQCNNTAGSFNCVPQLTCQSGYKAVNGRCEDINECLRNPCNSNEECRNTRGTYTCTLKVTCRSGYHAVQGRCEDVNECLQNPCSADENCQNIRGSYRCIKKLRCPNGYRAVSGQCRDINECTEHRPCSADKECKNIPGSYRCVVKCSRGYERVGLDCQDIDECKQNPCNANEQCENRRGSYLCKQKPTCQRGYQLVDGSCKDIDECSDARACRSNLKCINFAGSYKCESPCRKGFERRRSRCQDIDECSSGTHTCKPGAERCYNYQGGFSCRCNSGFRYRSQSKHCEDIDECLGYYYCSQECVNTVGSYTCKCRKGYTLTGKRNCIDIDECAKHDGRLCQHECINTQGSHQCRCKGGYTLNNDNRSCSDIDECSKTGGRTLCSWRCLNTPGSYRCECPRGFTRYYGRSCLNVDECVENRQICGNDKCIDTKGHYKCIRTRCPNNHFIKRTNMHCARKACDSEDVGCNGEKRKSIRWYGQSFPNNAGRDALQFTYSIVTRGYQTPPEIKYTIKSGNSEGMFLVRKTGYGLCLLKNIRTLRGPREYVLELDGEVINNQGIVDSSFITYLHIYVSKYEFY